MQWFNVGTVFSLHTQWRFYDGANGGLAPQSVQSQAPQFQTQRSLPEPLPFGAPQNTGAEPLQFDKSKTATAHTHSQDIIFLKN